MNDADPGLINSNQQDYHRLHQTMLYKTTKNSKQTELTLTDLVQHPAVLQTKRWDRSMMYPRYTFETGQTTLFACEFFS